MPDDNKPEGTNDADPKKEDGWDKTRQHKDEINAAKKREDGLKSELDANKSDLDEAQTKLQEAETELEQLKEAQAKQPEPSGDSDQIDTYEKMVSAIEDLKGEVKVIKSNQSVLQSETQQMSTVQKTESSAKVLNDLLDRFDKEFGPYRNEVIKDASQWFKTNKIASLPPDQQRIASESHIKLLYAESKLLDKSKPKDDTPIVDTGEGGAAVLTDIQEGTPDEVEKQILQKKI